MPHDNQPPYKDTRPFASHFTIPIEASHSCMTARGVRTPGVDMTTSRMMGVFLEDSRSREEVLKLMGY